MNVALFAETYVPEVNGVVYHLKSLKEGLEKLGHNVLVITADKHARHHYIQDGVLHCPALAVKRFYNFGVAGPYSAKRQRLIAQFSPDVLHIHQEFGIGLSGLWAARQLKKPLIYTLHTMYDQYIYYIAPRPLQGMATKFSHTYTRFIARRATALTGPSQKCVEYFRQNGVDKELNLIPNSVDLDAFDPTKITDEQKAKFREKFGIPEDRMLITFCGRLGQEKSVDVLLNQFASTIQPEEKMHLIIIGEGPDKEALEQQAKELGIADRVTFTGRVNHDLMPACFAACDAYATASLSEMNSISMLEGMASGLPVLQRFDELNASQIIQGENGHLYHTAEELASHLRDIKALSPEELRQMKERVIATVRNRGSTELASYMIKVYEAAIHVKR